MGASATIGRWSVAIAALAVAGFLAVTAIGRHGPDRPDAIVVAGAVDASEAGDFHEVDPTRVVPAGAGASGAASTPVPGTSGGSVAGGSSEPSGTVPTTGGGVTLPGTGTAVTLPPLVDPTIPGQVTDPLTSLLDPLLRAPTTTAPGTPAPTLPILGVPLPPLPPLPLPTTPSTLLPLRPGG